MPPLRRALLCLLACLSLTALAAAPASAQWADDAGDPSADWTDPADPGWDEGADAPPAAPEQPIEGFPVEQDVPQVIPRPAPVAEPELPLVTGTTVKGKAARLRTDGKAAVPRGAPKRVRRVIAAANQIVGKPYKWGGGHGALIDRGYDCSGAVGYALIRGASLLRTPMVSGAMARWGSTGAGRWITVYANAGHVYMEVAGLRLDTSAYGDPSGRSGVRWRQVVGGRRGFHVRHPIGL